MTHPAATEWLTKHAACEHLSISPATLDRRIADGSLPAYRVGGHVRIKRSDLEKLPRRIPVVSAR